MLSRSIILLIIVLVLFLVDLYTWQGIRHLIQGWNPVYQRNVKWIFWGLFVLNAFLIVLFNVFRTSFPDGYFRAVAVFVTMQFLPKLFWVVFLLLDDVLRLFRWLGELIFSQAADAGQSGKTQSGISRLDFLVKSGFALSAGSFALANYGIIRGAHHYKINRVDVPIPNLPEELKGLKIVQISDIHSGSFWSREGVERGVEMILKEEADLILFTGDLVNDLAVEMQDWMDVFRRIQAPMGVYSVLGNHDYGDYVSWNSQEDKQRNFEQMIDTHAKLGWRLLMNEHLVPEQTGGKLAILGIENWSAKGRFPKYGKLNQAYQGAEEVPVKILLSHDPSHWKAEVLKDYNNIQLTLSGHTHGFQFGIETGGWKWSPVKYMYPEWAGLYSQGNQHLYVNRGFGYIGYPGRLGIRPEITVIRLRQEG